MSESRGPLSPIPWFDGISGIAYRYYDLRMTIVPLVHDQKESAELWRDVIYWWLDYTIKIRFVESSDDTYWFIMGAQTKKPSQNLSFYKNIAISDNYARFKNGHDGEAYLRLGVYEKTTLEDVKKSALCSRCGHEARDHDENDNDSCLYHVCDCESFVSFQVTMSRRKKTITDIKFISESDEKAIRNDPLVWNCLYTHKYSKQSPF